MVWATLGRSPGAVDARKRFVHVGVTVLNAVGRPAVFLPPPPAPRDTRRTLSTLNQSQAARTYPGTDSAENRLRCGKFWGNRNLELKNETRPNGYQLLSITPRACAGIRNGPETHGMLPHSRGFLNLLSGSFVNPKISVKKNWFFQAGLSEPLGTTAMAEMDFPLKIQPL